MENKAISPTYLFYFQTLANLIALIVISILLKNVIYSLNPVAMISVGLMFALTLIFNLWHLNRHVRVKLIGDSQLEYKTLFQAKVTEVRSIDRIRKIWVKSYLIRIEKKTYIFYGFESDVLKLRHAIRNASDG